MKKLVLPVLTLCLGVAAAPAPRKAPPYDILFTNARVVDGTGAPWFAADVGVRGGKIAAVGKLTGASAKRMIDATGLVVAPGFIDLLGQSEYTLLVDGRAASKITQGITTEVTGEGESIAPIDEKIIAENQDFYKKYGVHPDWRTLDQYFATLERRGTAINLATFIGSGGVRAMVMGRENRPATPAELQRMEAMVDQAMRRPRNLLVAPIHPEHLFLDRRAHRSREGRRALWRGLLHAPALGVQPPVRLARRGLHDCAGSQDPHADLALEDCLQAELRPDA